MCRCGECFGCLTHTLPEIPASAVDQYGWIEWGYKMLVEQGMGVEALMCEAIGSYQGDYLFVVTDGNRFGFLTFGYGSCSGCDALQACGGLESLTELRNSLYNSIHWEPSRKTLAQWMRDRDWEGQWFWHEEGTREFVRAAVSMLEAEPALTNCDPGDEHQDNNVPCIGCVERCGQCQES